VPNTLASIVVGRSDDSLTQIKKQVGTLVTASPLPEPKLLPPRLMSALPPKADIADTTRNVRFVPKADIVPLTSGVRGRGGLLPPGLATKAHLDGRVSRWRSCICRRPPV